MTARTHRLPLPRTVLEWRGPGLVGVLNVTPDSFSETRPLPTTAEAVAAGLRLRDEGAIIVDVGGESTRPGAANVPEREELARVIGVVEALAAAGVIVSIDTRKAAVAAAALRAGAQLVNDVGGLRDPAMLEACLAAGAPAVIMHMLGEPATMQLGPSYADVVAEVEEYLLAKAEAALTAGLPAVVIDPGLGFGKDLSHNLALLRATGELASHCHLVMVGASRKSFVGRLTGVTDAAARLPGTLAAHLWAAAAGAALLRVHDVAAHVQALAVWRALATDREEAAA